MDAESSSEELLLGVTGVFRACKAQVHEQGMYVMPACTAMLCCTPSCINLSVQQVVDGPVASFCGLAFQ